MKGEHIKTKARRWWYNKSKGRLFALAMLACVLLAMVLDTRCPDETVAGGALAAQNATVIPLMLPDTTPTPVTAKLATTGALETILVDASVRYYAWFNREAQRVDIPPKIIARWAWWESALNTKAVSRDGYYSRGVGQFIRSTWEENAAKYGYSWDDAFDPEKNIRVMADYMAFCRSYVARPGMTESEIVRLMLAAYNRGPAGAVKYGIRGLPSRSLKAIADTMAYAGY